MAYFQKIDEYPYNAASPTGQPGCFTCGTPKRTEGTQVRHEGGELLVDLGVTTDLVQELNGDIHAQKVCILCEQCLLELSVLIGCMSPDHAHELTNRSVTQMERIHELEAVVEDYNRLKKELGKVRV